MTERAYEAARRLAQDPSATPAERENAQQRVREYEAQRPPPPPRSRVAFGGVDLSDIFTDINIDPRVFWTPFGTYRPPSSYQPPPRVIRPSADEVKRYGAPIDPPEPARVRVATTDQVEDVVAGRRPRVGS